MTLVLQNESTEFVYVGITGDVPSVSAEAAFMTAAARPGASDWTAVTLVPDSGHSLWNDAQASGAAGDYFVATLVGSFGTTDFSLATGDYQQWLRLTDSVERPVRIAPEAVEVAG